MQALIKLARRAGWRRKRATEGGPWGAHASCSSSECSVYVPGATRAKTMSADSAATTDACARKAKHDAEEGVGGLVLQTLLCFKPFASPHSLVLHTPRLHPCRVWQGTVRVWGLHCSRVSCNPGVKRMAHLGRLGGAHVAQAERLHAVRNLAHRQPLWSRLRQDLSP